MMPMYICGIFQLFVNRSYHKWLQRPIFSILIIFDGQYANHAKFLITLAFMDIAMQPSQLFIPETHAHSIFILSLFTLNITDLLVFF